MGPKRVKPRKLPEKLPETPGQKAARTKHGKAALKLQLEAAKRMVKAQLSLNQITGIVGETWAVANLSMLSTNSATAPFDGWLPDGRTLEVKCRYAPRGSGSLTLNSRHKRIASTCCSLLNSTVT